MDLECEKKKILETAPPYAPEGRFEEEYSLRNGQKDSYSETAFPTQFVKCRTLGCHLSEPQEKIQAIF